MSNNICQFFLRGKCKFGNSCRYKHTKPTEASTTSVEISGSLIKADLSQGNLYPFSCYSPQKNGYPPQNLIHGIEMSFEELRMKCYENRLQYVNAMQQMLNTAIQMKQNVINNADMLARQLMNPSSQQQQQKPSAFGGSQSAFGGGSSTANVLKSTPPTSSVFGGGGGSGNAFGGGTGAPISAFGSNNGPPVNAFGSSAATNAFGNSAAINAFGTPQQPQQQQQISAFATPAQPYSSVFGTPAQPSSSVFGTPGGSGAFGQSSFGQSGFGQSHQQPLTASPGFGAPSINHPIWGQVEFKWAEIPVEEPPQEFR